ncbi:MAG: hypothetical protein Q8Q08_12850 [Candidatus Omnitrophota bacterium]|nr:hypothetical protein [Candidatus Omnitrophota bacterium]
MAVTVTINGVDRSANIDWPSLSVSQIRSSQVDSCEFRLLFDGADANYKPDLDDEVIVDHDGDAVFGGVVVRSTQEVKGPDLLIYSIEAAGFERVLDRRLVIRDLSGETGFLIVNTLMNDYVNLIRRIAGSFDNAETWVDETGTTAAETDEIVYGDEARSSTLSANGVIETRREATLDFTEYDNGAAVGADARFTFWVHLTGAAHLLNLRLRFGEETGGTYTNYFEYTKSSGFKNGWQQIVIDRADFDETGSPAWASIETVQVRAEAKSTGGLTVIFDDLRLIPAEAFTQQAVAGLDSDINYGRFIYEPLFDVFVQMAENNGLDWYIDTERDLHFFPSTDESAPFDLTDTSANYLWESLSIRTDISNIYNEVFIVGGEEAGTERTDDLSNQADGSNVMFLLAYRYSDVSVTLNDGSGPVTQTLGIDNVDDIADFDVLFNFQEKLLRWQTAPADGDIVEITGKPYLPIVVSEADLGSIATYGVFQFHKEDKSIQTRAAARELGLGLLTQHRDALEEGGFLTYEGGLRAGQKINITSIVRDVAEDFIINGLDMTMRTPDEPLYAVSIVSARTLGLIEILIQLLRKKEPVGDEALTLPAYNVLEEIQVAEQITIEAPENVAEDIEASEETEELLNFSPTWVAGSYSPTGPLSVDPNRPAFCDTGCLIT